MPDCYPLAVSLVSFKARRAENSVRLEWATSSEEDNDYFEIQRSPDAMRWESIIKTKGAGITSNTLTYVETDSAPLDGTLFYRLKIVDYAGKIDYSKIETMHSETACDYVLFPNPTTGFVQLKTKQVANVDVYTLFGLKVLSTQVTMQDDVIHTET